MTDPLPPIDPRHAPLLVMDYQNAIVDMLGEPDDLLSRAADAIALVRELGGGVGYVRVAFEDADLEAIPARPVRVREPLAQVDRPRAHGEGGHLGEDRRPGPVEACGAGHAGSAAGAGGIPKLGPRRCS
jgi:nicotinamidase-related amidase